MHYLAYRDLPRDSAFAKAVPQVMTAKEAAGLGTGYPPFVIRMIENRPVLTAFAVDSVARSRGL